MKDKPDIDTIHDYMDAYWKEGEYPDTDTIHDYADAYRETTP